VLFTQHFVLMTSSVFKLAAASMSSVPLLKYSGCMLTLYFFLSMGSTEILIKSLFDTLVSWMTCTLACHLMTATSKFLMHERKPCMPILSSSDAETLGESVPLSSSLTFPVFEVVENFFDAGHAGHETKGSPHASHKLKALHLPVIPEPFEVVEDWIS